MTSSHPPGERTEQADHGGSRYGRVVLLGFMASGKTVVGRVLAERLGWRHVDLDAEIEAFTGRSVADIFASEGEKAFRDLEIRLTPRFANVSGIVLSPGGGWATNPGLFDSLPADTLTVWLRTSPATVLARVAAQTDQPPRPLLAKGDPAARIVDLLAKRAASYRRAAVTIDTDDLEVGEIVAQLMDILRPGDSSGTEGHA